MLTKRFPGSSYRALEEARRTIPPDVFGATWLGQHGNQLTAVDGILRVAPAGAVKATAKASNAMIPGLRDVCRTIT